MTTALQASTDQFKAFADPTRLRILGLLAVRELCVCHLVEILDAPQPKISRHLAMLRRAGLVTARSQGPWRHYALPAESTGLSQTLLHCVETCLKDLEELRADRERLAATNTELSCS